MAERYTVSKVMGLLDSDNLDDFGLIESEDSDCNDGEVESYLPEALNHSDEELRLAGEEALGVGPDPVNGGYSSTAITLLFV